MSDEERAARTIARFAHAGQVTKSEGLDYTTHLSAVAALVPAVYKPAAWLHDVLEDTPTTIEQLRAADISEMTIRIVVLLTRKRMTTYDDNYEDYIDSIIASGDAGAITVKLADNEHNLRPSCPVTLRPRYLTARRKLDAAVIAGL